ncbi:hypothetical protein E3N88_07720 [Mikania micrantha]|uniref:Uncharacterized protein n=1 Tax=Mikania micrantha TaxID=192012 RepID=A0A5N6PHA5_9ASTR|nr:hypothetical protein E3N88_07720 [Mikania micrantha]
MGRRWSRICFVTILLLSISFCHIQGQPATTSSQPAESGQILDDTVRPDPLENLRKYRGGYDITNVHYWSSTAYTGIAGYVLGALWLLCGVVFGIYLVATICCKTNRNLKKHKKPTSQKQHYLWHIILAAFFTLLAIVGTGLVLGGNAKFHSRADKIIDIIIDTADDASKTIYNTTGAMKVTRTNLQGTNVDASTTRFLESTSRQLDSTADDIQRQARKNRHKIDLGLRILYVVSTVIFALNLVAVIALAVVGVMKIRRVLHILIALCWLITVLCWVFFGAYFFLSRFAGDTCTALEGFQQDPYNNSLSSILPCDQLLSAESALTDVSAGVYDLVNEVNANISRIQQDSSFGVCNPFSGPPDYNYQPNNCSENDIRIGDIPEDAFADILEHHCKPVKRDVKIVWAGLVFLSIVMVFLILTWTVEACYERSHRFSDGSVKPHHADDHMIELGRPEDLGKDGVDSKSRCISDLSDRFETEEPPHDGVPEEPPRMSKLQLKDCIEPLLNFTLALSIGESIDTGLSKEFCSNLLKEDDHDRIYPSETSSADHFEGVPPHPLYKHLALALLQSISSGAIHKMRMDAPLIQDDSSFKQKECEWNKIIQEKGSALIKMLEIVELELHVQEPFFSQLKGPGIKFLCVTTHHSPVVFLHILYYLLLSITYIKFQDVHWYASFSDMLAAEGLAKVVPGVETIKEGIQIYRKFYSEEREKSNGVLAILVKPSSQLYDHLAAILAALSSDGIQRLLGISHTVGTIPKALPLPKSALISAFSSPHNPDVKSSVLSDGARALAKHVNRSNGKFWGSFSGNDAHKNMLALKVINHLIAHSCWLNVHIVPPHGPVFEIRVQDGYGARWSLNPTKLDWAVIANIGYVWNFQTGPGLVPAFFGPLARLCTSICIHY